jgi:hypothetical protein
MGKIVGMTFLFFIATLFLGEVLCRLKDHQLVFTGNFLEEEVSLLRKRTRCRFDPNLGWIPENGIRPNGMSPPKKQRPAILAVGDSFTFGVSVSDADTWPAVLERKIGARVINAGVPAYGFDQTVLRAEQLVPLYHPDLIVVSLISDDIQRTELSEFANANKPYFEMTAKRLVRRNDPVPPPRLRERLGIVRQILGHSLLVHRWMRRTFATVWFSRLNRPGERSPIHSQGSEVSCRLVGRLKQLSDEAKIPVLVVFQYTEGETVAAVPSMDRLRSCVDKNHLAIVDLWPILNALRLKDPSRYHRLFKEHMTAEGNRLVGEELSRKLSDSY